MDRTVHRIAFYTTPAQIALADVEDRMYAKQLGKYEANCPVFITALPRAGTTLLLECLADLPEFASHWYRDMPFVLIPALWTRLSSRHRQVEQARERAHGDGVTINADSPEALEEVLWKAFWKRHYARDRIQPWSEKLDAEFSDFFRNHMRKVIHIRSASNAENARYVSKNNSNIARIGLLRRMFPDCSILLPFREPFQHAASLLRQHKNFLKIQGDDPFALEYMSAIGHYDFGRKLKPIDFDSWIDAAEASDPNTLKFWLEYWVAAYRNLITNQRDSVCFVSYEELCGDPQAVMRKLAEVTRISDPAPLLAQAANLHPPSSREPDCSGVPQTLLQQAEELHTHLLDAAFERLK